MKRHCFSRVYNCLCLACRACYYVYIDYVGALEVVRTSYCAL